MKDCLNCGERVIGRSDKKFCSDSCRSAFHYTLHQDDNPTIRLINSRLRQNYRILSAINPESHSITTRRKLMLRGFSFDFYTHIHRGRNGMTYFCLYDQGYAALPDGKYSLVRRQTAPV